MIKHLEATVNTAIVVAALTFTVTLVRREMRTAKSNTQEGPAPVEFVSTWRHLLDDSVANHRGIKGGPSVVEFVDLECPYCAKHSAIIDDFFSRDSGRVSYTVVHLPLPMHRFALPAAKAAECARNQGRFFEFASAVMRNRDSLGLKSWAAYAMDAGVVDTVSLLQCIGAGNLSPRIRNGMAFAEAQGIQSTPTVLVNGYRISPTPTDKQFAEILDSIASQASAKR